MDYDLQVWIVMTLTVIGAVISCGFMFLVVAVICWLDADKIRRNLAATGKQEL